MYIIWYVYYMVCILYGMYIIWYVYYMVCILIFLFYLHRLESNTASFPNVFKYLEDKGLQGELWGEWCVCVCVCIC